MAYILSMSRTHDGKVVGLSPWLLANHDWVSSDGKEVKSTFRCLAEITLNTMLNILLMLEYLGVLHLSNLIQLYILSTPNGGVS